MNSYSYALNLNFQSIEIYHYSQCKSSKSEVVKTSLEANKEQYKKESKSKKKTTSSKTSKTSKSEGGGGLGTADGTEEEAGESVFGKTDAMCMSMTGMSMSM